jgi:hypothetical protein
MRYSLCLTKLMQQSPRKGRQAGWHVDFMLRSQGSFSLLSELALRKRYVSRKADLNLQFSPR